MTIQPEFSLPVLGQGAPGIAIDAVIVPPVVLDAAGVARLLGKPSANAFLTAVRKLEAHGFPPKLPGLNRWSYPAIRRWLETNGQTFLPATPVAVPGRTNSLERFK